jgi:hypothetical protein
MADPSQSQDQSSTINNTAIAMACNIPADDAATRVLKKGDLVRVAERYVDVVCNDTHFVSFRNIYIRLTLS